MKNRTKLDFRKIVITLVLIILVTNMVFATYILNKSLATEEWTDFYLRVKAALENMDYDSLSIEDLKRFNEGPQGKELNRSGGIEWNTVYKLKVSNLENISSTNGLNSLQTLLVDAYLDKIGAGSSQIGDSITHTEEENKNFYSTEDEIVNFYSELFATADDSGPIYDNKINFIRELKECDKK